MDPVNDPVWVDNDRGELVVERPSGH
jgi:hypothetical protein